jgi:hypothetical protein
MYLFAKGFTGEQSISHRESLLNLGNIWKTPVSPNVYFPIITITTIND